MRLGKAAKAKSSSNSEPQSKSNLRLVPYIIVFLVLVSLIYPSIISLNKNYSYSDLSKIIFLVRTNNQTTNSTLISFVGNKNEKSAPNSNSNEADRWWLGQIAIEVEAEKAIISGAANETDDDTYKDYWIDPNFGARHPNGSLGMIVNPSVQRLVSPLDNAENKTSLFDVVDRDVICPGSVAGIEGDRGHGPLVRIRRGIGEAIMATSHQHHDAAKNNNSNNNTNNTTNVQRKKRSKILCMVYTVQFPNLKHKNLKAQAHTWGRRCDGFIAASNITDHSLGAINLPHLGLEEYGNMWQKIRTMWAYVFHNYLDDYDWVHITGDDVYVAVDNLRAYVDSPEMAALEEGHNDAIFRVQNRGGKANTDHLRPRPLLLGIPMAFRRLFFPAGGPGYTLNRAAVKLFGEKSLTNFLPAARDSREDVFMGSAFHGEGVFLADTRDAVNGTRYGSSAETSTYFSGGPHFIDPKRQKRLFGIEYALFEDNASSQQIGFHLKDDKKRLTALNRTISDSIYRYHTFLYNLTDDLCG